MRSSIKPESLSLLISVILTTITSIGMTSFYFIIPAYVSHQIYQRMQFVEESPLYEQWANVTQPIFLSVYVFNITNPDGFMRGQKPLLQEIGPYVFSQRRRKIITSRDASSVTYTDYRGYHFNTKHSIGSLEDQVFAINVPLIAAAKLVEKIRDHDFREAFVQPYVESLIDSYEEKLVVQKSVDELLFEGYDIPFVNSLAKIGKRIAPNLKFPADQKFGLLYGKNYTAESTFTVGSGTADVPLGEILEWNEQKNLEYWSGDSCNQINGTDGTQFSPFVPKDKPLYVFSTDLCRSIFLEHEKATKVKGIKTERFSIPGRLFADGDDVPENKCFCESSSQCSSGGVINISKCRDGAPIMLSSPHFYLGDTDLLKKIGGLDPRKSKHETFLDVQTSTGVVLRAMKRLQINIDIRPSQYFSPLTHVPDRITPVAWIEERMEATKSVVRTLDDELLQPEERGIQLCLMISVYGGVLATISWALNTLIVARHRLSEKIGDFY